MVISDELVAILAVPIVEFELVWPEIVAARSSPAAIISPLVVTSPKLAEPEASMELVPMAKLPETVAVLVSKLLAKIFPVTNKSPVIAT